MTPPEPKAVLHRYLQIARDVMLWKLDGVSEYDARRPLVTTGTNLLGLVKHLAGVEMGYFGETFGRPVEDPPPWLGDMDAEPNIDMWATPEETRDDVIALYHHAWTHADQTIGSLPLDAPGTVVWWGDRGDVTLHQILIHVIAETHRHAGHADILRELIDSTVGLRSDNDNMAPGDQAWWDEYRVTLEAAARKAAGLT